MPPSDDGRLTIQPITPLRQRLIIYGYIGFFALAWPFARIWSTKAAFVLKDDLHMPAAAIANFYLLVDVPAYLGFAFGLMRDRWNLFGRRDQGLLNVFCGLVTVLTFAAAALPASYAALVGVLLCSAVFGQLIGAGFQGLTSLLGQEHVMSGRIASVWQATAGVPLMVVAIIAGKVATHCTMSQAFLIGGCISLAVTLFTLWRPPEVYDEAENAPVGRHSFVRDVKVLLRTRELYPVVLLMFLWNFTRAWEHPSSST